MFRRRAARPEATPPDEAGGAFTYVHEGTVVRGSVEASGRMRVDGTVLGDVRVDGVLEVAAGGLVEGATVEASEVKVLGTVRSEVLARVRVEIWKGGTVEGDVTSAALDIEEGATFVGRSSMATGRTFDHVYGEAHGGASGSTVASEGDAGAQHPEPPLLPARG